MTINTMSLIHRHFPRQHGTRTSWLRTLNDIQQWPTFKGPR